MNSVFFNSKNGDRKYDYTDWCRYFSQFITNGVFAEPATAMQVQAIGGMQVRTAEGSAFVEGHAAYADGSDKLELSMGGATDRIDSIILRLDMEQRRIYPTVIEGKTAVEAIVRDGTFYDLALAEVEVTANLYEVTQAQIKDTRMYEQVCGFATGIIKQINTSELFAQYQAAWNDFVAQLGESDNVTISTEDTESRKQVRQIREQTPFGSMFMMV